MAADLGDVEMVTALLSNAVDIDVRSISGQTALTRAVYWGSIPCIRLLLAYGTNAGNVETDGCTVLHRAVSKMAVGSSLEHGKVDNLEDMVLECTQLLLEHGASVLENHQGTTPLHAAESKRPR